MADKFFHRITCELNVTTENANELYLNIKQDKLHPITSNEGKDTGRGASPTLSLTLLPDGGGWTSRPCQ